jgi:DeoR/GlpR family transcriptional regulator of sugar metabolism
MTKTEMRTAKLLDMLRVHQRVDVKTATSALNISEATVRRLFAQLEKDGEVIRVHGGVQLAPQLGSDYSFRVSTLHRSEEKTRIGRAAAETVASNERIFLDSGTTVLKLAESLAVRIQAGEVKNLIVVTDSLTYVDLLGRYCKVILIGGEVRVARRDVCGPIAEKILEMFHTNNAFLGADAINLDAGFMTTDERTAKMCEIVIDHADRVYVLADSEKFNTSSFLSYGPLDAADTIFTDDGVPSETFEAFTVAGAHIQTIAPDSE